jgi:hypothetical protein
MNGESYGTMDLEETGMEYDQEAAEYDRDEVDDMLEALMDSAEADEFAERRRRRGRKARRKPVPTAQGRPAYRAPAPTGAYVTQKQLKDALDRVGVDVRRNAEGIKTINARLGALDGRVDGVVTVATRHSRELAKLDRQMKVDGALELVEALNAGQLNAFQLLKGAAKSGFLGESKGALGNPMVIGGIGLLLRNPNILGGLIGPVP